MNVEEERQRIMELWGKIEEEVETSAFLGYLWEHKRELGELDARVERLEPKVIKLLETIPTLRRHSPEYRAHCDHFIMLIHHIEPTEEWMHKIRSDLEFMGGKIKEAKEAYRNMKVASKSQSSADIQKLEQVGRHLLTELWTKGRNHPIAKLSNLIPWMNANHQGIQIHPIGVVPSVPDHWLILALTADGKKGIVIPTLDFSIGPGTILQYYDNDNRKYTGMEALRLSDIISLSEVELVRREWEVIKKGKVREKF